MIYELLDTEDHPVVVVATADGDEVHSADCPCGRGAIRALRLEIGGSAPAGLKAVGLLTAVAKLMSSGEATEDDNRTVRRLMARVLEMTS